MGYVAWATLIAMALPVLVLLGWALFRHYPIWAWPNYRDPKFVKVLKLSAPIFVAGVFGQLYMIVDRRLASGLDAGSIASLNFANRLVQLPFGIFVMALSTVVFPALADLAAQGNKKGFAEALSAGLRALFILLVPATVGLWVLRYPIVRLAFERGSFDATDTAKTAFALGFYALGLLGLSAGTVLTRAFYSLYDTTTPVKVGILTAVLQALLALLLVHPLAHGGLALANSIGVSLGAVAMFYLLRKSKVHLNMGATALLSKVVIAALGMGVVSHLLLFALSPLGEVVALGAAVTGGLVVYALGLLLLRVDETTWALAKFKRLISKR